jgi:hypothetical protein
VNSVCIAMPCIENKRFTSMLCIKRKVCDSSPRKKMVNDSFYRQSLYRYIFPEIGPYLSDHSHTL